MARVYARRIARGEIELADVPARIRELVRRLVEVG